MRWGDAQPGDYVEYKLPGSKKQHGLYLGLFVYNDDYAGVKCLQVLGAELDSIPVVSLEDIKVSVRAALEDAIG